VTQASHYLFTLAECCEHRHDERLALPLREAMGSAVDMVLANPLKCILCGAQLGGSPSYLSLLLPHEIGWQPLYGGLCLGCGIGHERPWLQRQVEARAHLAFGEPAGHA
jgi:hypothetical protein